MCVVVELQWTRAVLVIKRQHVSDQLTDRQTVEPVFRVRRVVGGVTDVAEHNITVTILTMKLCRVKALRHARIFRPANRSVMPVRHAGSVAGGRQKTRTAS